MKKKYYPGELGELYGVKFLPSYMKGWPNWKIDIWCWILNHIPNKLAGCIERKIWTN